jgi:uncharacterized protein YuzB (UPF0349 family)
VIKIAENLYIRSSGDLLYINRVIDSFSKSEVHFVNGDIVRCIESPEKIVENIEEQLNQALLNMSSKLGCEV